MNLTLLRDDPSNDVVLQMDGRPLYAIDSHRKITHLQVRTTIRRLDPSSTVTTVNETDGIVMSDIEWHSFSRGQLRVNGGYITPERSGFMRTSETFFASDGLQDKWSIKSRDLVLTVNNAAQTPVARYESSSRHLFSASTPARIEISQHGLNILDEVVATWVWMERKRRQRQAASAAAG